jgi:hypothetical protein
MKRKWIGIAFLIFLFAATAFLTANLPTADFYENFYNAARGVFSGHSPYEPVGYICAPWGIIPLIPFALLPPMPAHGLYFATCLFILVYMAWKLRASPLTILAFILSPTVIGALLVGNLDLIAVAGILFPPALGLLLLLIKPQVGAGVALYYLVDFIRSKRYLEGIKAFAPVTAAYALALVFFPIWYVRMFNNTTNPWNRSLFPYSIPVGLFLLWAALRKRNPYFALAAAPFLAPYHTFYTYTIAQIGLLHSDVETYVRRDVLHILLTIFLWLVMLVFKL